MWLLLGISVLSGGVLAYEILLIRLFSIIQWHHFAYMIISLALLGYGASGTFIALSRQWLLQRFETVFATGAILFGFTAVGGFALAQRFPFNPLEVIWDLRQQIYLLQLYLLLAVPFFCAATCIGLAFSHLSERIHLIYRYDLLGAGAGALGIILVLFLLPPTVCLGLVGATGFLSAGLACATQPTRRWVASLFVLLGLASPFLWPMVALRPHISPYKGLSQALQIPGARVEEERSNPLGLLSVVHSPAVPFRHAPGLSLHAQVEIPPQIGVFTDGDSMTAITRFDGNREPLAYLDFQSAALPYHLLRRPRVLILGAGGGSDVLLALYHGARAIDAVELNPQMVDLVRGRYADFAGRVFEQPNVRIHIGEARSFAARHRRRFDLIQISLLDSFTAAAAGLYALTESSLYTVEAFEVYLSVLEAEGMLAITRWLKLPPRDSLKMFATAVTALKRLGIDRPGERLALIRSWNTSALLVKKVAFTPIEIDALKHFAAVRGFDVSYYPGIVAGETNRHNVLAEPYLFQGAKALLGARREAFTKAYKFHIDPATDDKPYFFRFFKWRLLPELYELGPTGSVILLEWGYVVLVATLVQATLISFVLILLPLRMLRRAGGARHGKQPFGRVLIYFFALGLAFLFIEIAFMQRWSLFLGHPLYAISVVLCAFLVFAGLGSGCSSRAVEMWQRRARGRLPLSPIPLVVAGIITISCVYLLVLPTVFASLRFLSQWAKVLISIPLIAPLAFCMGMPFPLGLGRVSQQAPELVPWAWGINGCASVISAVLATVLAIHWGFTWVVAFALSMYAVAAATARGGPWKEADTPMERESRTGLTNCPW